MMDKITKNRRSENMRRIRSKDTAPEIIVRKIVFSMGYRYRLHDKNLPGRPDLVFKKKRKIIFVHGCFWHQHNGCTDSHIPKSNIDYWKPKLMKNIRRDEAAIDALESKGWNVLVIWECQTKDAGCLKELIEVFLTDKKL